MKRVIIAVVAVLLLAGGGYAVADAYDKVPGILTLPAPVPSGLVPLPRPSASPSSSTAPASTAAAVTAALSPVLADGSLGSGAGAVVRDGLTGELLYGAGADTPRTLASVQKVLAALPITDHLDAQGTMATRVVSAGGSDLVLVAGGDTLLATGAGDPHATVGRAGLADLAAEVNAAAPPGALTVRLDTSYAAGPRVPSAWKPGDVAAGFTRTVGMIGLADNRPVHGVVPRQESDADALTAFVAALRATGRTVTAAAAGAAPAANASVLGVVRSAPIGDVLDHAIADSDNALIENLLRQAMVAAGQTVPADGNTGTFVTDQLAKAGITTTGFALTDGCGLGPGQKATLTAVDQVLALATAAPTKGQPARDALRRVVADLPVSGLTGTLADRFTAGDTASVAGVPRAKTGTLTGVTALAGVTTDVDGRLFTFAVAADRVPPAGTGQARTTLDRFVATLTRCGCR